MKTEFIITKDGSHSLLNTALNETYHSTHGAIQESKYVFIKEGLETLLRKRNNKETISILEVGFGTGLNALLTLLFSEEHAAFIRYVSLEAYPLEEEVWSRLNYTDTLGGNDFFETLHRAVWNEPVNLTPRFTLHKINESLQGVDLSNNAFDIVYFDAFAPSKQPDMWTFDMLDKVTKAMAPDSLYVTYCAKGQLKRDLKSLGLDVETLPGPPGKKEMVRATKS